MRPVWATIALAIGYGLWWIAPAALDGLGMGQAAELGQLGVVVVGLTAVERVAARLLH